MILVDGYNLLFHPRYVDPRADEPLEARRGRLVTRLAALAARGKDRMAVVFDGDARLPADARRVVFAGLEVRFSTDGTSADDEIVAYLGRRSRPGEVVVVTDDRELRLRVAQAGGEARTAAPLAERLSEAAARRPPPVTPQSKPDLPGVDWATYFGFAADELETPLEGGPVELPRRLEAKLRRSKERPTLPAIPRPDRTEEPEPPLSDDAVQAWLEYFGLRPPGGRG